MTVKKKIRDQAYILKTLTIFNSHIFNCKSDFINQNLNPWRRCFDKFWGNMDFLKK